MSPEPKQPPRVLPTLTEVVGNLPPADQSRPVPPRGEAEVATDPLLAAALVQESRIADQVMQRLQTRIDVLLEHRLRDALAPALARAHAALADEARKELSRVLREYVEQAVNEEITRHRGA